jgi:hypothetical protein
MFVRFRPSRLRLQVSLLETRRIDGKVRNEHVASLGSVEMPQTIETRIVFWQRLHERLAKLSNRLDATMQGKIFTDIHGRIPMVTPDEQREVQLRNAESDAQFWTSMRSMSEGNFMGLKRLASDAECQMAEIKPQIENAEAKAATARDRIGRLQNGETVNGGLGKPRTREDMITMLGLSKELARHCLAVAELASEEGDYRKLLDQIIQAKERAEYATVARLLRRKRQAEKFIDELPDDVAQRLFEDDLTVEEIRDIISKV